MCKKPGQQKKGHQKNQGEMSREIMSLGIARCRDRNS